MFRIVKPQSGVDGCLAGVGKATLSPTWVLEYCTLMLFLVLGSYYSYLYLNPKP